VTFDIFSQVVLFVILFKTYIFFLNYVYLQIFIKNKINIFIITNHATNKLVLQNIIGTLEGLTLEHSTGHICSTERHVSINQ